MTQSQTLAGSDRDAPRTSGRTRFGAIREPQAPQLFAVGVAAFLPSGYVLGGLQHPHEGHLGERP